MRVLDHPKEVEKKYLPSTTNEELVDGQDGQTSTTSTENGVDHGSAHGIRVTFVGDGQLCIEKQKLIFFFFHVSQLVLNNNYCKL